MARPKRPSIVRP